MIQSSKMPALCASASVIIPFARLDKCTSKRGPNDLSLVRTYRLYQKIMAYPELANEIAASS
jgi:hypothetical protein